MHILAVDDSPIIRKLIKKALEPEGFKISEAKNGKEALELYPKLKPDIITMDVTMPVMDGITAAKLIKQSNPNQKIIMLSAMGDRDLLAEARTHGITDFFTKPFKKPAGNSPYFNGEMKGGNVCSFHDIIQP